jgi:glyoxylase-like metal-dependent hydrolase (beta-lactamase superfamily II)
MEIAPRTHLVDTHYLGQEGGIAACVLETTDGITIVDPGPTSSLDGLERGLRDAGFTFADVSRILLTHIHLDHAGAAGTLVRGHPGIHVFVHERGAPHMADPSRLMASALRIYGDSLESLFGDFLPVPQDRLVILRDEDRIDAGDRIIHSTHAPGHASHHVAFLDEQTGIAFMGDTAGERFAPSTYVLPVTPPPDIDLEAWKATLDRVREWNAESIFITHFGQFADVDRHLGELQRGIEDWAERVRVSLDEPGTDEERAKRFVATVKSDLEDAVDAAVLPHYVAGGGIYDSWFGLARYWRKRRG